MTQTNKNKAQKIFDIKINKTEFKNKNNINM